MSDKTIAEISEIKALVQEGKEADKKVLASLQETVNTNSSETKAAIAKAEDAVKKLEGVSASILEIEQKMLDRVTRGNESPKSLGQIVAASDGYKNFAAKNTRHMSVQANTIIGQEGSPAVNSDTLVAPQRLDGIIAGAFRSLRVRDALPSGVTTSNAIEYTREATMTNNAAETAEGATKPESALTFELLTSPVATIATFIKASKQVLEDSSMLASYIDNRLTFMVDYRYDSQLVNGNGTGQNISGILRAGNYTAFTATTGENALDAINRMIQAVRVADYVPTAVMLNPADWGAIERIKNGTGDDRYVIGNPASSLGAVLWGLPVVVSAAVPSGTAIVGDFTRAYQVFNRMGTIVEMFEQDDTNVQENLVTIRAELRGCLATYVPAAVQAGAITV